MLGGARVLIVEDEALTALDLKQEVEDAEGQVVGPFATVRAALAALASVDVAAAILDANLVDRDVTPVAVLLLAHNVPILIHTGLGIPEELRLISPHLPVWKKPAASADLVAAVARMIATRPPH